MGGYNSELIHMGAAYHVQTEDKGPIGHFVETVVYCSGRVLSSRKTPYTHLLSLSDRESRILQFVKEQHSAMIADIRSGKLDHL
jgi:hypothetical protein